MQDPEVIVNGTRDAKISSLDRGLSYGDGVFETIAVKQSKLLYWEKHLKRLKQGCDVLGIESLEEDILKKEVDSLIQDEQHCVIKIIITRGVGGRGYKPGNNAPTRVVQKHPWPNSDELDESLGIDVTQCDFRISHQSKLSQIKHLNRLEQVIARSEWEDEFHDGLVCDSDDNVIEATSSNVFIEDDNCLITPDLTHCGVAGIMRAEIIDYCLVNKIPIEIREFKLTEINYKQGMLLCNSIMGLQQVHTYCEHKLAKTAIIQRLIAALHH